MRWQRLMGASTLRKTRDDSAWWMFRHFWSEWAYTIAIRHFTVYEKWKKRRQNRARLKSSSTKCSLLIERRVPAMCQKLVILKEESERLPTGWWSGPQRWTHERVWRAGYGQTYCSIAAIVYVKVGISSYAYQMMLVTFTSVIIYTLWHMQPRLVISKKSEQQRIMRTIHEQGHLGRDKVIS